MPCLLFVSCHDSIRTKKFLSQIVLQKRSSLSDSGTVPFLKTLRLLVDRGGNSFFLRCNNPFCFSKFYSPSADGVRFLFRTNQCFSVIHGSPGAPGNKIVRSRSTVAPGARLFCNISVLPQDEKNVATNHFLFRCLLVFAQMFA